VPVEAERLEPLRRALDEARVLAHETEGAKREGLEIRVRPEQPVRLGLDPRPLAESREPIQMCRDRVEMPERPTYVRLAEQRLDGREVVTVEEFP